MFERRLKIFLMVILMMAFVIVLRAAQVQLLQSEQWKTKAEAGRVRDTLVDAPRGRILDRHAVRCPHIALVGACFAREHFHLRSHHKSRIKTNTKLADQTWRIFDFFDKGLCP